MQTARSSPNFNAVVRPTRSQMKQSKLSSTQVHRDRPNYLPSRISQSVGLPHIARLDERTHPRHEQRCEIPFGIVPFDHEPGP